MGGGFVVIDRAIEGVEFAFLACDPGGVSALGTGGECGVFVSGLGQGVGSEVGGNALPDGVGGAFEVGERQAVSLGNGVKIGTLEGSENHPCHVVKFGVGDFGEGHGKSGLTGKGFPRHHAMTTVKIRATP
jgi:hypothetical protein